jgi:putative MFS transporter
LSDDLTIAQRLDRLPVTALHIAIFALCAFGLFAEVALSNSGIFLSAPYHVSHGELSLLLASWAAGRLRMMLHSSRPRPR